METKPMGDAGLMSKKARSNAMPLSSMETAQKSPSSSAFIVWHRSPYLFVISSSSCQDSWGKQVSASSTRRTHGSLLKYDRANAFVPQGCDQVPARVRVGRGLVHEKLFGCLRVIHCHIMTSLPITRLWVYFILEKIAVPHLIMLPGLILLGAFWLSPRPRQVFTLIRLVLPRLKW